MMDSNIMSVSSEPSSVPATLEDYGRVFSRQFDCDIYFARKKGKGHVESGKVCQDYCLTKEVDGKFIITVVADGHGGSAYTKSDVGAKTACEVLLELVSEISRQFTDNDGLEKKLPALISTREFKAKYISMWRERVINDYAEHEDNSGLKESQIVDKYGTTVLFAVITAENYILGQLGDGAILMFNDEGQSQLFRRIRKTSSSTQSMVSSKAEFAFVTGTFPRDTFNRLLLSTDGIHDMLSKKSSFLLYGQELVQQAREYEELLRPFTVRDIEVSEETTDDCTISLVLSGKPARKYSSTLPQGFFPEKVSFMRAVKGAEFYETSSDGVDYVIHVVDEPSSFMSSTANFYGCEILNPEGEMSLDDGRSLFIYKIPKGFVSIQVLIDRCKHLEKVYETDDDDDERDTYSNTFWLNIYERLLILNHEIAKGYLDLHSFFPEVMFVSYNKILITSDAVKTKKRYTPFPLKNCLDYFNIIGKLSFGASTLPLFGCNTKGQPVNVKGKALCQVVYDKDRQIFGLWNISDSTWNIEGENGKEIPAGKIMRLTDEALSFTADGKKYMLNMYPLPRRT